MIKRNKKVKKGFLVDLRYSLLISIVAIIGSAIMIIMMGLVLSLTHFIIYKIAGIFIK